MYNLENVCDAKSEWLYETAWLGIYNKYRNVYVFLT